MPRFFARVELFRADGDDYDALHERMSAIGFGRTVKFDDGGDYKLPIGTYTAFTQGSTSTIRERVSTAADPLSARGRASVLVIESSDWAAYLFK